MKSCYSKTCAWKNSDNTCSFSECFYEWDDNDEWDGDIPGQYMTSY